MKSKKNNDRMVIAEAGLWGRREMIVWGTNFQLICKMNKFWGSLMYSMVAIINYIIYLQIVKRIALKSLSPQTKKAFT